MKIIEKCSTIKRVEINFYSFSCFVLCYKLEFIQVFLFKKVEIFLLFAHYAKKKIKVIKSNWDNKRYFIQYFFWLESFGLELNMTINIRFYNKILIRKLRLFWNSKRIQFWCSKNLSFRKKLQEMFYQFNYILSFD